MSTIIMKEGMQIYYKDWCTRQPVVFSNGYTLSVNRWEDQIMFLASNGVFDGIRLGSIADLLAFLKI